MNMISEQIKELRNYERIFNGDRIDGNLSPIFGNAANTIEELSEKLKNGGWIPCSERLPDKWEDVMICYYNDREEKYLLDIACLDDNGRWRLWRESGGYFPYNFKKKITHWRPFPSLPEGCHG